MDTRALGVWLCRKAMSARRAALALSGGAAVAVVAWPERPGEPSVRTVLRWLPSGLLGWALHPTGARVPSFEVVQREACSNVAVQLCGVCHVEEASAEAARACVDRCASGALHAVALECDAVTFGRVRAAAWLGLGVGVGVGVGVGLGLGLGFAKPNPNPNQVRAAALALEGVTPKLTRAPRGLCRVRTGYARQPSVYVLKAQGAGRLAPAPHARGTARTRLGRTVRTAHRCNPGAAGAHA